MVFPMVTAEVGDSTPGVSVIVCSHNSIRGILDRTLAALRAQTLPLEESELLIVDNGSETPLAETLDLSWHPCARVVQEPKLGHMMARLRGLEVAAGRLIVFVDDDNVLNPDYLETAVEITRTAPQIGAFGGNIVAEFETPPEPWCKPFLSALALREVTRDSWSNGYQWETVPFGAGMCLTRAVAEAFKVAVRQDESRLGFGRIGELSFGGGDDIEMAFTACDMGLGCGVFAKLRLTHIIPRRRLERTYLTRIVEGGAYTGTVLLRRRGLLKVRPLDTWRRRLAIWLAALKGDASTREHLSAKLRGRLRALRQTTADAIHEA